MGRPSIAQCDDALKTETRVIAQRDKIAPVSNFAYEQIVELAKRSGSRDFCTARATDRP
jgi:hypothetical protein